MLTSFVLFIILFGVLVFVHELGHFLVNKAFGVYVEKFSIGFGPKVIGKKVGETEYQLAAIPLGGYVKMLGDEPGKEVPPELAHRAYLNQAPLKRMAIVMAGPIVNIVFPIVIYFIIFVLGVQRIENRVGFVEPNSPAQRAGLQIGDRIAEVDGEQVFKWNQIDDYFKANPGKAISIVVKRDGQQERLKAILESKESPNKFGEIVPQGFLGISFQYLVPRVIVDQERSAAYRAGIRTGDWVRRVCGKEIYSFDQIEGAYQTCASQQVGFELDRPNVEAVSGGSVWTDLKHAQRELSTKEKFGERVVVELSRKKGRSLKEEGICNVGTMVDRVTEGSPAEKAGFQKGDVIVSISGQLIDRWDDLAERVEKSDGKPMKFVIRRNGSEMAVGVTAVRMEIPDPLLGKDSSSGKEAAYRIGVLPVNGMLQTSTITERYLNPVTAVYHAVRDTVYLGYLTVVAMEKLVTGKLSSKILGGPIMIYKFAGQSYQSAGGGIQGIVSFLQVMALLSMSLGILNLLPIPILDGGHVVFYIIEAIRRRPLPSRVIEWASQVGFVVLMAIICLAFYNDIVRWDYLNKLVHLFK